MEALDLAPGALAAAVNEQAATFASPPQTAADLLDTLTRQGLFPSAARPREAFGSGR